MEIAHVEVACLFQNSSKIRELGDSAIFVLLHALIITPALNIFYSISDKAKIKRLDMVFAK